MGAPDLAAMHSAWDDWEAKHDARHERRGRTVIIRPATPAQVRHVLAEPSAAIVRHVAWIERARAKPAAARTDDERAWLAAIDAEHET